MSSIFQSESDILQKQTFVGEKRPKITPEGNNSLTFSMREK